MVEESGTSFLNQSQSELKQNQSSPRLLLTLRLWHEAMARYRNVMHHLIKCLLPWYAEWVLKHHSMLWISWEINEIFLKDSKDHFHRIAYKEFKSNFLLLTLDVCYDWLTEKKKDSLALKVRVCFLLKY